MREGWRSSRQILHFRDDTIKTKDVKQPPRMRHLNIRAAPGTRLSDCRNPTLFLISFHQFLHKSARRPHLHFTLILKPAPLDRGKAQPLWRIIGESDTPPTPSCISHLSNDTLSPSCLPLNQETAGRGTTEGRWNLASSSGHSGQSILIFHISIKTSQERVFRLLVSSQESAK